MVIERTEAEERVVEHALALLDHRERLEALRKELRGCLRVWDPDPRDVDGPDGFPTPVWPPPPEGMELNEGGKPCWHRDFRLVGDYGRDEGHGDLCDNCAHDVAVFDRRAKERARKGGLMTALLNATRDVRKERA